jgi:predicted enzyme related to lactoylglutathione lyase
MELMNYGRMSVITDPGGATLALWQAREHAGAEVFGEPNTLAMCELVTKDVDGCAAYYEKLFGWTIVDGPPGGPKLKLIRHEDRVAGTIVELHEGMGPIPPHWAVYMAVNDCEATLAKAAALGGTVIRPAMDIGVARIGGFMDPQGAALMLWQQRR